MATETPWHKITIEGTSPGEGCQFVWLHGWGHDHKAFERLASLFKNGHNHTLYDQPGFGKTPLIKTAPDKNGADTRDYADALASQLSQNQQHIIVGHSYGARVAVQLAAAYPGLVKAIILVSGAGLKRKRSLVFKARALFLRQLGKTARFCDKLFSSNLYTAYANRFGSSDYKNAGELRPVLVNAVNEDLSMVAKTVSCPTLLIYGSEDTDTPPEIGKRYENLIPIARYEEINGYDHLDILTRGAYQCEALIKTFLKDLSHG